MKFLRTLFYKATQVVAFETFHLHVLIIKVQIKSRGFPFRKQYTENLK